MLPGWTVNRDVWNTFTVGFLTVVKPGRPHLTSFSVKLMLQMFVFLKWSSAHHFLSPPGEETASQH